jgi:hypothetical protein
MAHFGCNLCERPASREIAGEYELGSVNEPLSCRTGSRHVCRAQPQRSSGEGQGEALRFQRLRKP